MQTYVLRGVEVHFPHQAYDCQIAYMEKVIQSLQEGRNALLESPTGTGKTLCLLCAALAWRQSIKPKAEAEASGAAAVKSEDAALKPGKVPAEHDAARQWAETLQFRQHVPPIVYASRTHSQLAQVIKELRATAYRPRMCILGSRQQLCLHAPVARAPAGGINQACRAAVQAQSCLRVHRVEGFISRQPDLNQEPLDIEDLLRLGQVHGPCPFYLSRELAGSAELVFLPYNYLIDAKIRTSIKQLAWEGAVLIFDEAHNLEDACASAASFDISPQLLAGSLQEVKTARDVALKMRENNDMRKYKDGYGGCGLRAARDAGMGIEPNLTADLTALQRMLSGLEGAIALVRTGKDGFTAPGKFLWQLFGRAGITLEICPQLVMMMVTTAELLTTKGELMPAGVAADQKSGLKLEAITDMLRLAMASAEPGSASSGRASRAQGYRVHIHTTAAAASGPGPKRPPGGQTSMLDGQPTLSYWCFTPGAAMHELANLKVRCMILTSGTLSPLDSFAAELQLPFPITLENPHVIEPSQAWVGVVPVGPAGRPLNSSYANRDSPTYREDLGNAIVNFARMIPDGVLVFFPSYVVLRGCIEAWKASYGSGQAWGSSIWERISAHKQPVIEPQDSGLFPRAVADFQAKLKDPSSTGAIFFAVCRGKISEGLDFSDRAGRAVIITGIPFAMKTDAKVKLKKEVLDEMARAAPANANKRPRSAPGAGTSALVGVRALTGEAWYVQTASRAVNQAMGRVIRHRHDYGAIILCDDRFQAEGQKRQLSCWLRNLVKVQPHFGAVSASLAKFFREQSAAADARIRAAKQPAAVVPARPTFSAIPSRAAAAAGAPEAAAGSSARLVVPAAVDCQGLAELHVPASAAPVASAPAVAAAGGQSELMTALHAPQQHMRPSSAAGAKPYGAQGRGTLTDSLWAAVDGGQLSIPQQKPPRPKQPAPTMGDPLSSSAAAQQPSAMGGHISSASNSVGPAHLIAAAAAAQQHSTAPPASELALPVTHASSTDAAGELLDRQQDARQADRPAEGGQEASKESAKDYLDRLQRELPDEAFQQVRKALRSYRSGGEGPLGLIDSVVEVLRLPGRQHLLAGFTQMLSKPQRAWFRQCLKNIFGEHYVQRSSVSTSLSAQQGAPLGTGELQPASISQQPASTSAPARDPADSRLHMHRPLMSRPLAEAQPSANAQQPEARLSAAARAVPRQAPALRPDSVQHREPARRTQATAQRPQSDDGVLQHHRPHAHPATGMPTPGQGHAHVHAATMHANLSQPQPAPAASHRAQSTCGRAHQSSSGPVISSGSLLRPGLHAANDSAAEGRQHTAQGSRQPSNATGPLARSAAQLPPSRQQLPAGARGNCIVCSAAQPNTPWQAKCGHIACYGCWVVALSKKHACPECARPTQLRQLTQRFFG